MKQWQNGSASMTNPGPRKWPSRILPKKKSVATGYFKWLPSDNLQPAGGYKDPIVAQETNRVDYPNGYPLDLSSNDKANAFNVDNKTYDDDTDQPATVWKVNVVGERMAKSVVNSQTQDDDENDEETPI
jgi:hypothetical protein